MKVARCTQIHVAHTKMLKWTRIAIVVKPNRIAIYTRLVSYGREAEALESL